MRIRSAVQVARCTALAAAGVAAQRVSEWDVLALRSIPAQMWQGARLLLLENEPRLDQRARALVRRVHLRA